MPAFAQASSLSPPGAPLTPIAPMTWVPALMGTPPGAPVVPSMLGAGGFSAQALPVSPEVLLKVSAENAFFRLKAFVRDDGSGPHTIDFSRKKAFSALTFKRTSGETGKAWAENPPAPNIDGTTGAPGGVPIKAGTQVIGAIGVSGAPGGDKDEACANAGIAKIAAELK